MNVKPFSYLLFGVLLYLQSALLFALPEDNQHPLLMSADSVDLDQKKHVGIYIGHVTLDQGSTHIRAAKTITQGDAKNHLIQATLEGRGDQQAHYWTLPSLDKPELHAYADKMIYFPDTNQIILNGHAKVIQDANKITASTIKYNTQTQRVTTAFEGEQTHILVHAQDHSTLEMPL